MEKEISGQIRPIYNRLMGYLSAAPSIGEYGNLTTEDNSLWEQFNAAVDELNKLAGENKYIGFKITKINFTQAQFRQSGGRNWIYISEYRNKLNGLIMQLYGEYFSAESAPFSGQAGVIVSQNQTQSQETHITMIMEFQTLIDEKLYTPSDLKPEEKTFLEKIKGFLPKIKSATELVKLIISTAKDMGLDIGQIYKLFT